MASDTNNVYHQALDFKTKGNTLLKQAKPYDHYSKTSQHQYSEIIATYTNGISLLNPAENHHQLLLIDLLNNRSHVHTLMQNYENAIQDAQQALQLQPTHLKAMMRLAKACLGNSQFLDVLKYCDQAMQKLDPTTHSEPTNYSSSTISTPSTQQEEELKNIFTNLKQQALDLKRNFEIQKAFSELNEKNNEKFKEMIEELFPFGMDIQQHSQEDADDYNISLAHDQHGESFLHYAARSGNLEMVKYLIEEKKVFKNMQNFRGASPLYYAAFSKCPEIVDYLIELKADPTQASSFSGKKPHEICQDPTLKIKLTNYFIAFENIKRDPVYNFKYRMAEYWRDNFLYFRHPARETYFDGFQPYPMARVIAKGNALFGVDTKKPKTNKEYSGLSELLKVVLEKEAQYEEFFNENPSRPRQNECLICRAIVQNCPTCTFCGKVNICRECETNRDPCVTIWRTIHKNNCRSGLYF